MGEQEGRGRLKCPWCSRSLDVCEEPGGVECSKVQEDDHARKVIEDLAPKEGE